MSDFSEYEERFSDRTENELKKLKLSAEYGADFKDVAMDQQLPEEIEGQFLDYIQQWEEQYARRERITVFDFVSRPEWRPIADLSEEEILQELSRIEGVFDQNGIQLTMLCEVSASEVYRFVTEELFPEEIDNIRIPGMKHSFIYEDFHPNHEYDIRNRCEEVIQHMTDGKERDMAPWGLAEEVLYGAVLLTKNEVSEKLGEFSKSFSRFNLDELSFTEIQVSSAGDEAKAVCCLRYSGIPAGGDAVLHYTDYCEFFLKNSYGWWLIDRMNIEGMP
jgi:hypothetical protein